MRNLPASDVVSMGERTSNERRETDMTDEQMLALYLARDEQALAETAHSYGRYCHSIAQRILGNEQDSEECVNDAYARAWATIPPEHPASLCSYMGMLTRNLAIDRLRYRMRERRGGERLTVALDELEDCLCDDGGMRVDDIVLRDALARFLGSLPERTRSIFLQRYFYLCSVEDVARIHRLSVGAVKSCLHRTRERLKVFLQKEGISV
jgi:RNA polymerase sigma-70 factor (ECF subfamily)